MKGKFQRKVIFDIFSKNLQQIKKHPSISFKPDFDVGYICPICFDVFFEKDLITNPENNYLTIEHVPPQSVGGKPLLLTCKKCNSNSGWLTDFNLLQRLKEIDARDLLPNTSFSTMFRSGQHTMNGTVHINKDNALTFDLDPKRTHPVSADNFKKSFDSTDTKTTYNPIHPGFNSYNEIPISLTLPNRSNEHLSEVGLLRIAYLIAFSNLGNAFLLNGALYKIREQLSFPNKELLAKPFGFVYNFPEELIGINIIREPKLLRSYLIIFNLCTKAAIRQYAIMLPGPSAPGIDIYKNLSEMNNIGEGSIQLEIEHLPNLNYVKDDTCIWGANYYWQKFCSS